MNMNTVRAALVAKCGVGAHAAMHFVDYERTKIEYEIFIPQRAAARLGIKPIMRFNTFQDLWAYVSRMKSAKGDGRVHRTNKNK